MKKRFRLATIGTDDGDFFSPLFFRFHNTLFWGLERRAPGKSLPRPAAGHMVRTAGNAALDPNTANTEIALVYTWKKVRMPRLTRLSPEPKPPMQINYR